MQTSAGPDERAIASPEDVVDVRQAVRQRAVDLGFNLIDQTKLVTAASELARNTIQHGRGGTVRIETVTQGSRVGLRLTFEDRGPGISDVNEAMRDGFSTAGGLGLGLGGARRLTSEFTIVSRPGGGTRVTIVRWK